MGPRGFSKLLEIKAAYYLRTLKVSVIPRWKPKITNEDAFFVLPLHKTYLLFSDSQHSVRTIHHFEAHSLITGYLTDDT